jgi:23S rRNA pseudouridine1911/1915/1917 synthase
MKNHEISQEHLSFSYKVLPENAGMRIDLFVTLHLPMFSRSTIKKLLQNKQVLMNNIPAKPSSIIKQNDTITLLSVPSPIQRTHKKIDSDLQVTIIAQEKDFLIINKPAGLVVHPPEPTYTEPALTDWLVDRFPSIVDVGDAARPGIVHRLDRNTSGIMIIALTNAAYQTFVQMFKDRLIQKTYLALVVGHPPAQGTINFPIGRHPVLKNMMHSFTALPENNAARQALTDYTTLSYFENFSLIQVQPKTGRTHQIRTHFKAIGHPLLGDSVYGSPSKIIDYHALHATELTFSYQGTSYHFTSPLDKALQKIITTQKNLSPI